MPIIPWKVLETSYVRPRFRIDKCELPNGNLLDANILELNTWVNVFAFTATYQVVLIQQYRHGIRDVLWEIPGGVVEDGENPLDGAKRELLEETGYVASEFIEVGKMFPNPAFQTNILYCYIALNAEKVAEQHLDGGEDIEVHLVLFDELLEKARRGEFPHALQVASLFYVTNYLNGKH